MDVLSDVLRMIRLEGALFLNGEFREPWCVDAPSGGILAQVLHPGAQNLAICHFVLEGQCWAQLLGEEPVLLQAGDVVTFPHGDSHLLGSGLQNAPVSVDHAQQVQLPLLTRMRYGGDGNLALVICGWFAYERDIPNPLISALPRMFCTSVGKRPSGPWIEQSIRYALDEGDVPNPGSNLVRAKVAEMLFVEALRGYIEALPAAQTGWLSGLRDPQISKCLALMHSDPARAWSVTELAHEVHMSRSVMAERFTQLVNMPPMQYLKRLRLAMAAGLLCNELSNLAKIAETIGYESEAAFNRAFKREYGVAPGLWRLGAKPVISPAALGDMDA
jgi:AraC-like DNA-binding protein